MFEVRSGVMSVVLTQGRPSSNVRCPSNTDRKSRALARVALCLCRLMHSNKHLLFDHLVCAEHEPGRNLKHQLETVFAAFPKRQVFIALLGGAAAASAYSITSSARPIRIVEKRVDLLIVDRPYGCLESIRTNNTRHGWVPRFIQAWLVACWITTSPALTCTMVSSSIISISPAKMTA